MTGALAAPARRHYPLFADIGGRRCLVVGGGPVAAAKARKLSEHGAVLRVVAPALSPELSGMVQAGAVAEHRARPYRAEDLDGCLLAVAATDDRAVNAEVAAAADDRAVLCDVVDDPGAGSFIVPSLVRRGDLAIAVSTGGASPVVAARARRRLEESFGPEWGGLVALLGELREELKRRHPDTGERRAAVERVMDAGVLARLAAGDEAGARSEAREILGLGVAA